MEETEEVYLWLGVRKLAFCIGSRSVSTIQLDTHLRQT